MIPLFHIPKHSIDTARFSNLLHDKIVREFEERFANYVGAEYAVSFNSATSAIFLAFYEEYEEVEIPSILPPVVANALSTAMCEFSFVDNTQWVGHSYVLHKWSDCCFIDSAQRVDRNQFKNEARDSDLMLFSFYPTKPVSGSDGGMIVSNNKSAIDQLRERANNGMSQEANSWERKQTSIGFKMYMNSIQAYIASENLKNLDYKREHLSFVRYNYNVSFGLVNTSDHLYRAKVRNNVEFVKKAKEAGIECGIHYQALHHNPLFQYAGPALPKSDEAARTMVSIPFHENLTKREMEIVIEFVKQNRE